MAMIRSLTQAWSSGLGGATGKILAGMGAGTERRAWAIAVDFSGNGFTASFFREAGAGVKARIN